MRWCHFPKDFNFNLVTDRVRSTTVRYCFHRCLSVHRGGGGGFLKVPTPLAKVPPPWPGSDRRVPQGTYPLTKVHTPPQPGPNGEERGTPRYLPPSQDTYPRPGPKGGGESGYPKVPTHSQFPMGGDGYPKVPTPWPRYLPSPPPR